MRWGPKSTKTRYSITDSGVLAFREWMDSPLDYAPVRDAAHMRAAYFEWADPDSARDCLRRHIDHYADQIACWTVVRAAIVDATNATIAVRLRKYPAEEHERIVAFKAFAYDGLMRAVRSKSNGRGRGLHSSIRYLPRRDDAQDFSVSYFSEVMIRRLSSRLPTSRGRCHGRADPWGCCYDLREPHTRGQQRRARSN